MMKREEKNINIISCLVKNGHTWIAVLLVLKYYDNLIYQIFWHNFYHLLFLETHFKKKFKRNKHKEECKSHSQI